MDTNNTIEVKYINDISAIIEPLLRNEYSVSIRPIYKDSYWKKEISHYEIAFAKGESNGK